jgi:cobalt/nickel transport protein
MTKLFALLASLFWPALLLAHFQELIPSEDIMSANSGGELTLDLAFTHPMSQGPLMTMEQPIAFGVINPQGREDLSTTLITRIRDGKATYQTQYRIQQPGDHIFFLEPSPYWEASEGKMITQYTKVVVDAYEGKQNWQTFVGFPLEIKPLVRPYGLWQGNLFRGEVRQNGQPLPYTTIEVEWRNDGSMQPPAAPYITQVIQADASGTFSYAMPRAGWWGFAALTESEQPVKNPQGELVPEEIGSVIWVRTREMK